MTMNLTIEQWKYMVERVDRLESMVKTLQSPAQEEICPVAGCTCLDKVPVQLSPTDSLAELNKYSETLSFLMQELLQAWLGGKQDLRAQALAVLADRHYKPLIEQARKEGYEEAENKILANLAGKNLMGYWIKQGKAEAVAELHSKFVKLCERKSPYARDVLISDVFELFGTESKA